MLEWRPEFEHSNVGALSTVSHKVTILQSCPATERNGWLARCMDSVKQWARTAGYNYQWIDDALFDLLPAALKPGGRISPVIASDLARLRWMQQVLRQGAECVVWLDADVLVFAPAQFQLLEDVFAVGREIWVQPETHTRWRVHRKVHNAFMQASDQGDGHNSFVDFYADSAERLLRANGQVMPAQFIGPKLLTALHNVIQMPVLESAGMLSPAVVADLLASDGPALRRMRDKACAPLHAANLCRSSVAGGALDSRQMEQLIDRLLAQPQLLEAR